MTSVRKALEQILFLEQLGYNAGPFEDLVRLVKLVARGVRKSLFIYGGPGIGKTYTVIQTLNGLGLKQNKDWFIFSGKMTIAALYKQLFLLRNDKILVFDDMDDSWNNPDSAALLKAALDTATRSLNWFSSRTTNVTLMGAPEKQKFYAEVERRLRDNPSDETVKFPSEFVFTSRVIFISNKTAEDMNAAVLTRVLKIDMTIPVPQVFKRMAYLISQGQLGPPGMTMVDKINVLNTLIRLFNAHQLKNPSLRTFVAAAELQNKGEEDWTSLLQYT